MQHRLLTVLLNYKTPEMTLQALEAARIATAGIQGGIVVVDNDSQDGSFETLTRAVHARGWDREDAVRVVQSGHNGGFGAGNNFGIRTGLPGAPPDLVYILNSDAFPAPDAVKKLIGALEAHPQAGLAGSYIHGPDGEPHITAFRFPSILSELEGAARFGPITRLFGDHKVPLPLPERTGRVDWLAGASLMMRREMLDRIGLFDENFFLYFEETDLCLRAARAGWQTLYVRESEVSHIGSVSTGMKSWTRVPGYWFDSRLRYFTKNHGPGYAARATMAHLAGGLFWRLRRIVQRKPRVEPLYFLRQLAFHHARALLTGRALRPGASEGISPRRADAHPASQIGE